jgi:hypothetical protein
MGSRRLGAGSTCTGALQAVNECRHSCEHANARNVAVSGVRNGSPPLCSYLLFSPPVSLSAGELNDLHSFDPATMTWTLLSSVNGPPPRAWHGFTSAGGKLYVYGGAAGLHTDPLNVHALFASREPLSLSLLSHISPILFTPPSLPPLAVLSPLSSLLSPHPLRHGL